MKNIIPRLFLLAVIFFLSPQPQVHGSGPDRGVPPSELSVPILLYHRFGPIASDGMTVTTSVFESHLRYLKTNGFTVIRLRQLVDYYLKKGPKPPPKSVVLVADDGHESVYRYLLPMARKYRVPVTLFLYPSAISNASYAMTWDQLRELKAAGLFDFEGHTYWHPNFKKEEKRLSPSEYDKFVDMQLKKSKAKLEKELDVRIDMLAWPFGIYNDRLIEKAKEAGYAAAFTIEARPATERDELMKLPRYLMINAYTGRAFARIVQKAAK